MPHRGRENFSERSCRVIELAEKSAIELGHGSVNATHLALGLMREGQGVAAAALQSHGIGLGPLAAELIAGLHRSTSAEIPSNPQLNAEAEGVLDRAAVEAEELDHPYVGTEHILLALLRDSRGLTAEAFARHGFSFDLARARVVWILNATPENHEPFIDPKAG
jgi:ATP-dependent Clp protease ATP-binding subunit ClpC